MTKKLKLRAAPAMRPVQDFRIDRDAGVIRDVCAMQAGIEALGHGCQADLKTLYTMAELGNQRGERGIKQHFGHIGLSENAMGKQVAVARNFRVDGDKLRHDMVMLPPARFSPVFARDPIDFLFNMAEAHPADFGESVVVEVDLVWTLDDGREVPQHEGRGDAYEDGDGVQRDAKGRPVNALTPLPVMRPTKFYYVDVVVDGALTHDGLFGADTLLAEMFSGTSSAYLYEGFRLFDQFRDEYGIPLSDVRRKVDQAVTAYLASRGFQEATDMGNTRNRKFNAEGAPAQDVPPQEEAPEESTQPIDTDTDAELDAALEEAEATEQRHADTDAESEGEGEAAPAPTSEQSLAAANQRIAQLEAVVMAMSAQIAKLTKLTAANTRNISVIDHNVQVIAGDPAATMSVPTTPQRGLTSMAFASPVPPTSLATQRPRHVTERTANIVPTDVDFDADPDHATLMTTLARQQANQ